jgi:hypothetical protein
MYVVDPQGYCNIMDSMESPIWTHVTVENIIDFPI